MKYNQLYTEFPDEKVYQVSIWTDPQAQITAVNFETKEHAAEHMKNWPRFLKAKDYNGDPADFKHKEFLLGKHPEIESIDDLDYQFKTHRYAADARISTSLRKVVKRILNLKILENLPREDELWVGINSPHDWYDHVIKVKVS